MSLTFTLNSQTVVLGAFDPNTTVLDYLRLHAGLTGSKEGCASGDCGACTVIVNDGMQVHTVNACICLLGRMHGKGITTVEALADGDTLHPVQQAFVEHHASQCGFCTPGFIMSAAALHHHCQNQGTTVPERSLITEALAGNLCRCTGYRPIIDATQAACRIPHKRKFISPALPSCPVLNTAAFKQPDNLAALLEDYAAHPEATLVAGGTDLVLNITQSLQDFSQLIDISDVPELQKITVHNDSINFGAAVSFAQAMPVLTHHFPHTRHLLQRIGSLPIRHLGTLGGNLASASPIGDMAPLAIALQGEVTLLKQGQSRRIPIEQFFSGYRQTVLQPEEIIGYLRLQKLHAKEVLFADKVSKRIEDDISTALVVGRLKVEDGIVTEAHFGLGGMAATPVAATALNQTLTGQSIHKGWQALAASAIEACTTPISDIRGSRAYRLRVTAALVERMRLRILEHSRTEVLACTN